MPRLSCKKPWYGRGEGLKTLSGVFDRVSLVTVAGTAVFEGGASYVRYR